MTVLAWLASIFGTLMGISQFPQAYRIFKRKSAKDISFITYFLLFTGTIIWILYGIEIKNVPLLLSYSVGLLSIGSVLVGWWLYR